MKTLTGESRRSHVGFIANAAVLVAVAAVAAAMMLERATSGPDAPLVAWLAPKPTRTAALGHDPSLRQEILPRFDRVDTTPTASIGPPIVIDPCLRRPK